MCVRCLPRRSSARKRLNRKVQHKYTRRERSARPRCVAVWQAIGSWAMLMMLSGCAWGALLKVFLFCSFVECQIITQSLIPTKRCASALVYLARIYRRSSECAEETNARSFSSYCGSVLIIWIRGFIFSVHDLSGPHTCVWMVCVRIATHLLTFFISCLDYQAQRGNTARNLHKHTPNTHDTYSLSSPLRDARPQRPHDRHVAVDADRDQRVRADQHGHRL